MGKGSDGRPAPQSFLRKTFSMEKLSLDNVKNDLIVLKNIWFNSAQGADHAARLDAFYGPQAEACELGIPMAL
jgi:betaine lipid synthase